MTRATTRRTTTAAALAVGAIVAGGCVGVGQASAAASPQATVQVWLAPNLAGAAAFAAAVSTPGNAQFHHYLSPNAYTARFGPSAAHVTAVEAWLKSAGMTDVRVSSGRDYVSATGPVAKVTSVPAALAPDVLAVTGLDDASAVSSQTTASKAPSCSQYWAQHVSTFKPAYGKLTKGSLPVCGYSAGQLRAAYGATSAATGKGQTVALIEDEAPVAMFHTLTDYAKANGLPAPATSQFRQVTSTGVGGCGSAPAASAASKATGTADADTSQMPYSDESEMDSEAVYAMAPGANQLMVVGSGCGEDQSLLDAALSVLTGNGAEPSATIESNSWQIPLGGVSVKVVHAIDLRAVAEGVGMYFAAGDTPGLTATGEDPDATVVGGTAVGIGAKDDRLFETGWSNDYVELDGGKWNDLGVSSASGGGTSLDYAQPAYQNGVVPTSMSHVTVNKKTVTDRAVPDIAADADTNTGMLTGYIATGTDAKPGPYQTEVNGGTSLACPLVAGLIADAQQGQSSALGFVNPLIYGLYGTAAFHDTLPITAASTPQQNQDAYTPAAGADNPAAINTFDAQDPASTTQVTAKGYDTMTGLGTPNGQAFITALRKAANHG
ncbi:MAG TPA: protease pro-enzyme activation domain-containing protein [Actinospica sp.]|nr:protease pro-enzyme activation domain-containing protein [Actinospica sp.]